MADTNPVDESQKTKEDDSENATNEHIKRIAELNNSRFSKRLVIFVIVTVLSALAFEYLPRHNLFSIVLSQFGVEYENKTVEERALPLFAIYGKSHNEGHLRHVLEVLHRIGYSRTTVDNEWDLLWAHDYPFRIMPEILKNLKPHQKVNHFPGCGYITNKVDLSTSDLPFIPKAFRLPIDKQKFIEYSGKNPNKLFVEKHNEHRYISIKPSKDINFDSNVTFLQEFISNPFLVDGYKFDVGVYVIITSVDPLRVYIYTGDVLFRYCPVKYYPFNATNVDKYVVGDDYLPTWELPSLKQYYTNLGFSMKDSFDAYVLSQSQDPKTVWKQVEDQIRETIKAKEKHIVNILKGYNTANFFELMRFDLIIDNELTVYLLEANMSPNLSSAHFKPNSLLYEQILYSVMNLVGIGSIMKKTSLKQSSLDIEAMISSDKNLAVDAETCSKYSCDKSCDHKKCQICLPCLSKEYYKILHSAYREHIHRADTKRIFPKPIINISAYDIEKETKNLSPRNEFITRWFYGKCKVESTWCY